MGGLFVWLLRKQGRFKLKTPTRTYPVGVYIVLIFSVQPNKGLKEKILGYLFGVKKRRLLQEHPLGVYSLPTFSLQPNKLLKEKKQQNKDLLPL